MAHEWHIIKTIIERNGLLSLWIYNYSFLNIYKLQEYMQCSSVERIGTLQQRCGKFSPSMHNIHVALATGRYGRYIGIEILELLFQGAIHCLVIMLHV